MKSKLAENLCSLVLLAIALGGAAAPAITLEHVSTDVAQTLRRDFADARNLKDEEIKGLAQKTWTCDMYGMRSRLQVERGVSLYRLTASSVGTISNGGAQVVRQYTNGKTGLRGESGPVVDLLRVNARGELLAELSVKHAPVEGEQPVGAVESVESADRVVLAYSVCRQGPSGSSPQRVN